MAKEEAISWEQAQTLGARLYELKQASQEWSPEYLTYISIYGKSRCDQLYKEHVARIKGRDERTDKTDSTDLWP